MLLGFFFLCWVCPALAAPERWHEYVSPERFGALALRLAPRVDLFQAIWAVDPDAELYGGTSRDFLWFLRRKFSAARSVDDVDAIVRALEARVIDAREFIAPESDVDVISTKELGDSVLYDPAFVTRIERVGAEWFRPKHPRYEQELQQGGIPVEKIRLGRQGFRAPVDPALAGGVEEIHRGVPTLGYRDTIRDTQFFRDRENHPLLLVLRWLRQTSVAYFQRFGRGAPSEENLREVLDETSIRTAREIVAEALRAPETLRPFFAKESFSKRVNRQVQKSYRSHINPTVARLLHARFSIDEVLAPYVPAPVRPYHSVMFAHRWADDALAAWAADAEVAAAVEPFGDYARREGFGTNGASVEVLHGTPSLDAYRSLVFAGAAPSESGSGGSGLYASDRRHRGFVENWRKQERPKELGPLVVRLRVRSGARFVDTTRGSGQALWKKFDAGGFGPVKEIGGARYDAFARRFGVDVLRFEYGTVAAYVVKNGDVLESIAGDTMPLMTYRDAAEALDRRRGDASFATTLFAADRSLWAHLGALLAGWPKESRMAVLAGLMRAVPGVVLDRWPLLQARLALAWPESVSELIAALERDAIRALVPPPARPGRHDVFFGIVTEDGEAFSKRVRSIARHFPPAVALRWFRQAGLLRSSEAHETRATVVKAVLANFGRFRDLSHEESLDFEFLRAIDTAGGTAAVPYAETQLRLRSLGLAFAAQWPAGIQDRLRSRRAGRLPYFYSLDDFESARPSDALKAAAAVLVERGDAEAAFEEYERAWRFRQPVLGFSTEVLRRLVKKTAWSADDWRWWAEAVAASATFLAAHDPRLVDEDPLGFVLPGFRATDETRTGVVYAVRNALEAAEARISPPASAWLGGLPAKTRLRLLQAFLVDSPLTGSRFLPWVERLWPEGLSAWDRDLEKSALELIPAITERDGAEGAVGFLERLVAWLGPDDVRAAGSALSISGVGAFLRVPVLSTAPGLREKAQDLQRWHWQAQFAPRLLLYGTASTGKTSFFLSRPDLWAEPSDADVAEDLVRALPEADRVVGWSDLLRSRVASAWMVGKLESHFELRSYLPFHEWKSLLGSFAIFVDGDLRARHLLGLDHAKLPFLPDEGSAERLRGQFLPFSAEQRRALRETIAALEDGARRHPFLNVVDRALESAERGAVDRFLECVRQLAERRKTVF